ncbi:hypothetical protein DFP72DRAFT_1073270 [Ephemerocybe angulata]|uniref:Uncharacterized protein n=1 Tax=Ephemerocybe angulata TaxID=980116 RepID=A0A8H6HNH2_9AGAR|nr:hypothetical protein DFP72DRAFT_1073270 [Tulosesus angulatus]
MRPLASRCFENDGDDNTVNAGPKRRRRAHLDPHRAHCEDIINDAPRTRKNNVEDSPAYPTSSPHSCPAAPRILRVATANDDEHPSQPSLGDERKRVSADTGSTTCDGLTWASCSGSERVVVQEFQDVIRNTAH